MGCLTMASGRRPLWRTAIVADALALQVKVGDTDRDLDMGLLRVAEGGSCKSRYKQTGHKKS